MNSDNRDQTGQQFTVGHFETNVRDSLFPDERWNKPKWDTKKNTRSNLHTHNIPNGSNASSKNIDQAHHNGKVNQQRNKSNSRGEEKNTASARQVIQAETYVNKHSKDIADANRDTSPVNAFCDIVKLNYRLKRNARLWFVISASVCIFVLMLLVLLGDSLCPSAPNDLTYSSSTEGGITTHEYRDKDNNLVKWFYTDLNGQFVEVDHDGRVYHSAASRYEDGKEVSWVTYSYAGSIYQTYDKNGNLLSYLSLNADDNPLIDPAWGYYKVTHEYFPESNIVKNSIYYTEDRIEVYTYNEASKLVNEAYYDLNMEPLTNHYPDGIHGNDNGAEALSNAVSSSSLCEHKYNENGDMIEHIQYNEDGALSCVSKYNENGNVIEHIQYNADGSIWCIKKYNDDGELIEHIGHESTSPNHTNSYEAEGITHTDIETQHMVVRINGITVNLRSGPGTKYSIVASAKKGTVLDYAGLTEVDANEKEWHSVIHPENGIVWVSSLYGELI